MPQLPSSARIIRVPYSEVAMHMRLADKILYAAPTAGNMVQLYDPDNYGHKLSFPITRGEAGIDLQWVQVARDGAEATHDRKDFPVRWTAFVDYDGSIEEIDFDSIKNLDKRYLREFCEGVLALDYDSGWQKITFEERFGMYL